MEEWVVGGVVGGQHHLVSGWEEGEAFFLSEASRHANHFSARDAPFFFFHTSFLFVMAGGEEDFNLFNQLVFIRGTLFG